MCERARLARERRFITGRWKQRPTERVCLCPKPEREFHRAYKHGSHGGAVTSVLKNAHSPCPCRNHIMCTTHPPFPLRPFTGPCGEMWNTISGFGKQNRHSEFSPDLTRVMRKRGSISLNFSNIKKQIILKYSIFKRLFHT